MTARIAITDDVSIDADEIEERFVRAGGPGGQHVNKTSTAVQLRFDARSSASLTDAIRKRLQRLAGNRLTKEGVIVITARTHASQARNRAAARARLIALLRRAAQPPKTRRATATPSAQRAKRMDEKAKRGAVKKLRRAPGGED